MSNFAIISDSASDVSAELRERFGIDAYLPGILYTPDGRQTYSDPDWKEMTPEEYYESMTGNKLLYKTAFPSRGDSIRIIEPFLKEGKDVLLVLLSSGISGAYQSSLLVSKELMEKYPERKIICVDSLRYASAIAFMLVKACEKRAEGATIEETAEFLNDYKYHVHQMGPLDDLFFTVKTGRISNLKAFFGTLVGVNCLGDFSNQGLTEIIGKVKGKQSAMDATVEYIKRTIVDPQNQIVFVAHSNRPEFADTLVQRIKDEIKPKEVILNRIGMACGSSIGPGLYAAYYCGNKISDDLEAEKAAMNEVIADLKKK